MAKELDNLDAFLAHKTGAGAGGKFLKDWKKIPGYIDTFLHTRRLPIVVWSHNFPKVFIKTVRETGVVTRKVFSTGWNCWEDEEVLKDQYRVEEGRRLVPPQTCPMCRLTEVMRWFVFTNQIHWCTPVFNVPTQPGEAPIIIHAGGMFNQFGSKKLTDAQKEEMRKYRIFQTDAWKENCIPKAQYVFTIVDVNNVSAGVQITTESSLLGDKVKTVIADAKVRLGAEKGNPILHPYAIRWESRKNEEQFDKKYHAIGPLDSVPLTPAILALIKGEPPNLDRYTARFNVKTWRAFAEAHYVGNVTIPWDVICAPAEKLQEEEEARKKETDGSFNPDELEEEDGVDHVAPPPGSTAPNVPAMPPPLAGAPPPPPPPLSMAQPAPPPDDETVACDDCNKEMAMSDPKCPHCGKVYVVEQAAPPPPPPRRTRSQAQGGAAAPPPPPPPPPGAVAAPPPPPGPPDPNNPQTDKLPF